MKVLGIGSADVAIGASGVGSIWSFRPMFNIPEGPEEDTYEFYGRVQSGIITPVQEICNLVVLDLKSKGRDAVKAMFRKWTIIVDYTMDGDTVDKSGNNPLMPPVDAGKSIGLGASKLMVTSGISKSLMKKIGLSGRIPDTFRDLLHFPNDQLIDDYSDDDIMIQACSSDSQISFHAAHNLVRPPRDIVKVRWAQPGFISAKGEETPRNLMAFKDGTISPRKNNQLEDYVFIDDGQARHRTYCVVRRIQVHTETWDRTALEEQEATLGRKRHSDAPLTGRKEFGEIDLKAEDSHGEYAIDKNAHMRLAKEANMLILHRALNYVDGTDNRTGNFETGLLFVVFQKAIQRPIDIQDNSGSNDKLSGYITHRGSTSFLVLPGISKEGYFGEALSD